MKPNRFDYHDPATVDECVALLAEHGDDAKPLAGGQSLVPLMNLRLAAPAVLVDLNGIAELSYVSDEGDTLAIGAMTRHRTVAGDETVRAANPLLAHAASLIGYPAIRVRGTIGGSLSHADPVSELPCVAVALGAEFVIAGAEGRRTLPASEFFQRLLHDRDAAWRAAGRGALPARRRRHRAGASPSWRARPATTPWSPSRPRSRCATARSSRPASASPASTSGPSRPRPRRTALAGRSRPPRSRSPRRRRPSRPR